MTTTSETFSPLAPVESIDALTPALDTESRQALLCAINGTRMGIFVFSVAVEYDKQTDAKPRLEGTHYVGIIGTTGKLHLGTLVAAPTNKKDEVYLRIADMARADGTNPMGWTALKLCGIKKFQVRGAIPGPAAQPAPSTAPTPVAVPTA